MNFRISVMLLSVLFFIMACKGQTTSDSATDSSSSIELVDVAKFNELMKDRSRIVLDVRTPGEIAEGAIPGAMAIDYRASDFEQKIKALDRDKEYLMYCRSGGRSGEASELMKTWGFKKVYDLKGGYIEYSK